eukprot:c40592_g1_i1.p1 GENE.c40592_g1_i1~~c40592_g1_i1.p1  ORF type:complete len:310 (-),score=46.52 c40592_g1_i1:254-1183(-)
MGEELTLPTSHYAAKLTNPVARVKSTNDFVKLASMEEVVVHSTDEQGSWAGASNGSLPRVPLSSYGKTDKAERPPRREDATTNNNCASVSYAVIYFFAALTLMMHTMNYVHYRLPSQPPLPDIGHDLIPVIRPENVGDYPMFVSAVIVIGLSFVHDRTDLGRALPRFLATLASMYLLRLFTISVTTLPVTDNHCRFARKEIMSFWKNTLWGLITLGMKNVHCGDLMFSGHTIMIVLLWEVAHTYFARFRALNWVVTFCTLMSFFLIVATRSHYTFDIIIGWYVTVCCWKVIPGYWPYALGATGPNATVA